MRSDSERFGPTRRGGPVFRWLGEPLAIDFANTVMVVRDGEEVDLIAEPEGLRRWLDAESDRVGEVRLGADRPGEVRSLRDAVRTVLAVVAEGGNAPAQALEAINAASAGAPVAPRLERDVGGSLRSAEGHVGHPSGRELRGLLARETIALVTGPDRHELHICRAPSCGMFFIGARRWCCPACGNRARAARHYARRRIRG